MPNPFGSFDAVILGAGVFGLATAFEMARRGARVQVLDPVGVGAGASGGVMGALAPHAPEKWGAKKAFQLDCLLDAPAFWADVTAKGGVASSYAQTGRLMPITGDSAIALAAQRGENATTLWKGQASWRVIDPAQAQAMCGITLPAFDAYVFDTLSGRMFPKQAVQSLAAAVTGLGGEVTTGDAALPLIAAAKTTDTTPVIWATGYQGLSEMSAEFGTLVGAAEKGQAVLLRAPKGFDLAKMPHLYMNNAFVIPHFDGTVGVGSTSEQFFDDPTVPDQLGRDVLARVCESMPELRGFEVIRFWAGGRPRSATMAPILGPYPGRPGHFVANGGFKIGFGVANGIARIMADLVMTGRDTIPDDFRLPDFGAAAS